MLAVIAAQSGQLEEAREALAKLAKRLDRRLRPDHPQRIGVLVNQANVEAQAGQWEAARKLYLDAEQRWAGRPDQDISLDLVLVWQGLTHVAQQTSRLEEARGYYARALRRLEARLGPHAARSIEMRQALSSIDRRDGVTDRRARDD